jgi:uncharacterized membrane protein YfcA
VTLLLDEIATVAFAGAAAVSLLGGVVYGFAGFGAALVIVPLLSWLYDPPSAVAIVSMSVTIGGAQLLRNGVRHAAWPDAGPMILGALLATPVGAWFLLIGDPVAVRRAIGATIAVFALIMLAGWSYRGRRNVLSHLLVGGFGGALNSFGSGGGPPISLYYIAWPGPAETKRATIYIVNYALAIFTAGALIAGGAVHLDIVLRMLVLLVPYSLGVRIGAWIVRRASDATYRRFVLLLLLAIGGSALLL